MGGILALQAQFDNEVRTERCKSGMVEAVKRGCWVWTAPTGFKAGRTRDGQATLYHDPDTAPIVRKIFETFAAGVITQVELTKKAKNWGLLTANGKTLSKQSIRKMLCNPVYAARIRTKLVKGEYDGNWEPIVDSSIFDQVQERLNGSSQAGLKHSSVRPEFGFKGFLICAKCGRKMTAYESTGKLGKRYAYYGCKCRGQTLSLAEMVGEFEALLDRLQMPEDYFEDMRVMVKKELSQAGKRAVELDAAKREAAAKLKREQEKLLDYLMRGTIDDDTYDSRLKKLRSQLLELDNSVAACDYEFQDIDATLKYARRLLIEPRSFWAKSNSEMKLQLQSLWCPEGMVFDKSLPDRTRLKANTPILSVENIGAVNSWHTRRDSNPKPPDP
ncbi:MAG: recombinase family protein [Planctomycetes bacterium]|nr:recombinase family protein [Planctomycetota bacterium]